MLLILASRSQFTMKNSNIELLDDDLAPKRPMMYVFA